ncbi:DUF924 family protein [Paraburkholderia dinghuensis]|uniref:DUF924 domain-containing protein n=1 Tax=Paraburkholderia dinghuensis TaxID=2305225 RepID=A0A3N6NHN8_9BURK|nr:DUF924 family protein [Paraburkholderia dinghuensis]RQH08572.1 DUF924 domain-containing protein [Paraburkholderia dinghuensis]
MTAAAHDPRDVLDFWFGEPGSSEYGQARKMWFYKDEAFDALLRERFGALLDSACAGELDAWAGTPEGALALLIVLDQFSRNCHRGTPRAFAADERALDVARQLVASGADRTLPTPQHRVFAYMPFEHAESMDAQRESLRLFGELAAEPGCQGYYDYAVRHANVIERFGRFPHRNAQLGRASSDEELAFLREPGSSF